MLSDALSFPRSGDDWIPTLLIGAVLIPLSVLVIPAFILQGYTVRAIRAAATDSAAPSFTDWGELLITGLKVTVIAFAYSLVINIPSFGVQFLALVGFDGSSVGALFLVLLLVILVLSLVVGLFAPAAVIHFALEDSFGAAFDLRTIWSGVATGDYIVAWLMTAVFGIVGGLIGLLLTPVLVGFVILFYVQLASYYLLTRGFTKGLGRTGGNTATTTATH